MIITRALLIFVCTTLLSINTAYSNPKELKAELIESWMSSQKLFEEWGKKHEQTLNETDKTPIQNANPMELTVYSMIQPLKDAGLFTSANKVALESGFEDLKHWAETTLRITKAAAALEFDSHPEMNDLSELTKLMNNPSIDKKQKTLLSSAIEKNKAMVKMLTESVSNFDKTAVKPFLSKIHDLIDQNN